MKKAYLIYYTSLYKGNKISIVKRYKLVYAQNFDEATERLREKDERNGYEASDFENLTIE